jgi:hypothetical protein
MMDPTPAEKIGQRLTSELGRSQSPSKRAIKGESRD